MLEIIMVLNVLQKSQWFIKFVTVAFHCLFYNLMLNFIISGEFFDVFFQRIWCSMISNKVSIMILSLRIIDDLYMNVDWNSHLYLSHF